MITRSHPKEKENEKWNLKKLNHKLILLLYQQFEIRRKRIPIL